MIYLYRHDFLFFGGIEFIHFLDIPVMIFLRRIFCVFFRIFGDTVFQTLL